MFLNVIYLRSCLVRDKNVSLSFAGVVNNTAYSSDFYSLETFNSNMSWLHIDVTRPQLFTLKLHIIYMKVIRGNKLWS